VEIALKASAIGVYQIAFSGAGGTELRIALVCLNFVVWLRPGSTAVFETAVWAAFAAVVATFATDTIRTAVQLWRAERIVGGLEGEGR
jgi:hypothetical protein